MKTLKDIDAAIEKYEGLTLFLAGVRSTMHELASIGKDHYERAEKAEAKLAAVGERIEQACFAEEKELAIFANELQAIVEGE